MAKRIPVPKTLILVGISIVVVAGAAIALRDLFPGDAQPRPAGPTATVSTATCPRNIESPPPEADLYEEIARARKAARTAWPETYAGVWMKDRELDSTVYFAFTEDAEAKVLCLAQRFPWPEMLVAATRDIPYRDLVAARKELQKDQQLMVAGELTLPGVSDPYFGHGIDEKANAIVVDMHRPNELAQETFRSRYGPGVVIDFDVDMPKGGIPVL